MLLKMIQKGFERKKRLNKKKNLFFFPSGPSGPFLTLRPWPNGQPSKKPVYTRSPSTVFVQKLVSHTNKSRWLSEGLRKLMF
jgi:hypothetical protein